MTIADISMLSTYSHCRYSGFVSEKDFLELEAWVQRCKSQLKNFEKAHEVGAKKIGNTLKTTIEKLKEES